MASLIIDIKPGIEFDDSRFSDISAELGKQSYDVVALQEVLTKKQVATMRSTRGFKFRAIGPSLKDRNINSGLLVLSKWPIIRKKTMVFSYCDGFECLASKGAMLVTIDVPSLGKIDVLNTHLNSIHDAALRKSQLGELLRFVRKYNTVNPLLALGDFNIDPDVKELLGFQKTLGLRDAFVDSHYLNTSIFVDYDGFTWDAVNNPHTKSDTILKVARIFPSSINRKVINNYVTTSNVRRRIDYTFYKNSRSSRLYPVESVLAFTEPVNGRILSDHFALETVFEY
ncbi:MAG: hypothetical protein A2583_03470 [Bdellovibrionales bacterium RIFOXYD1_FULL_53_11]|nr:MAG: hypothetical protein A2583_03470 [Bdellovibrionales bacterium RIFOXYD1_FULL_53_11]